MPFQQVLAQSFAGQQAQTAEDFDFGSLKNEAEKAVASAGEAIKKNETVEKVAGAVGEAVNNMDEKDKQGVKDQGTGVKEEQRKKATGIVKGIDAVANSPEVNIVGSMIGGEGQEKLKQGQKIIHDIATNPAVAGNMQVSEGMKASPPDSPPASEAKV